MVSCFALKEQSGNPRKDTKNQYCALYFLVEVPNQLGYFPCFKSFLFQQTQSNSRYFKSVFGFQINLAFPNIALFLFQSGQPIDLLELPLKIEWVVKWSEVESAVVC